MSPQRYTSRRPNRAGSVRWTASRSSSAFKDRQGPTDEEHSVAPSAVIPVRSGRPITMASSRALPPQRTHQCDERARHPIQGQFCSWIGHGHHVDGIRQQVLGPPVSFPKESAQPVPPDSVSRFPPDGQPQPAPRQLVADVTKPDPEGGKPGARSDNAPKLAPFQETLSAPEAAGMA